MKSVQLEIALAHYFGFRQNLVVPNISWGLGIHECDLMVVRKSGYAVEIEIKVSVQDLKADLKKRHQHKSNKIRELYFAMPSSMITAIEYVPEHAGIILVEENSKVKFHRDPKINTTARKLTEAEIAKVAHLGCMRIWTLKSNLFNAQNKIGFTR